MAVQEGVEPSTSAFGEQCASSTPLDRYKIGVPGWTQTIDLRIRSPLLYSTELQGRGAPDRI